MGRLGAGHNGESMATRTGRAAALVLALAFVTSGCRLGGLAFRVDDRLDFLTPEDRATVRLPFDITWSVEDFDVTGPDGTATDTAGFFAVLLDVSPMPPGESLAYYARDDDSCRPAEGCPDAAYLADRRIHTTEATTFTVDALADTRPTDRPSAADDHEITVLLLNGKGERIGESAFRLKVIVDRELEAGG
jgi:hypothetical protein